MKLALVNGFGQTSNVGDLALLTSTIEVLTSQLPGAEIHVIPWQKPDQEMAAAFAQCAGANPSLFLKDSALPAYSYGTGYHNSSLLRKLKIMAWSIATNFTSEMRARIPESGSAFETLATADLVILRGCNIVQRGTDIRSLAGIRRLTFPLWLASRAHRPIILMNVSVGPIDQRLARRMLRRTLNDASFVSARESLTCDFLSSLTQRTITLGADTAFALSIPPVANQRRDPSRIALNVLSKAEFDAAVQGRPEIYFATLDNLTLQLNQLLSACPNLTILAIPHEMDESEQKSDVVALKRVIAGISQPHRVTLATEATTAREVVNLYAKCSLAVGMRFHGYVLAGLAGTPTLGIDLASQKVRGVAKSLNLDGWMTALSEPGQLANLVQNALPQVEQLRETVSKRTAEQRELVFQTFDNALQLAVPSGVYR